MFPLPLWMRTALYATAGMNVLAAGMFLPAAKPLRDWVGLPELGHPLYATTVAMFIFLFGVAYSWTAIVGRADRVFIALSAAGKFSFFAILVCFWAMGSLPVRAPLLGSADLLFSVLFTLWLFGES
jgi:hypothetical protein